MLVKFNSGMPWYLKFVEILEIVKNILALERTVNDSQKIGDFRKYSVNDLLCYKVARCSLTRVANENVVTKSLKFDFNSWKFNSLPLPTFFLVFFWRISNDTIRTKVEYVKVIAFTMTFYNPWEIWRLHISGIKNRTTINKIWFYRGRFDTSQKYWRRTYYFRNNFAIIAEIDISNLSSIISCSIIRLLKFRFSRLSARKYQK